MKCLIHSLNFRLVGGWQTGWHSTLPCTFVILHFFDFLQRHVFVSIINATYLLVRYEIHTIFLCKILNFYVLMKNCQNIVFWKFDRIIETRTTYPAFNADNHSVLLPRFYASFLRLTSALVQVPICECFRASFAHRCLWLVALVWVAYVHKYLLLYWISKIRQLVTGKNWLAEGKTTKNAFNLAMLSQTRRLTDVPNDT